MHATRAWKTSACSADQAPEIAVGTLILDNEFLDSRIFHPPKALSQLSHHYDYVDLFSEVQHLRIGDGETSSRRLSVPYSRHAFSA